MRRGTWKSHFNAVYHIYLLNSFIEKHDWCLLLPQWFGGGRNPFMRGERRDAQCFMRT